MRLTIAFIVLFIATFTNGQTSVEPYPDNSWDMETYQYLNIPSIDKDWEEADLRTFMKYMEKIYTADKWSIPRKNSPYSGKLFEKMLSQELLSPIADKSLSLEKRIEYLNKVLEYGNFIAALYQETNRPNERFGIEALASYQFLLYSAKAVRLFMDEMKATLPKNAVEQPEFKKMYHQSTEQIVSLVKFLINTFEKDVNRYDNDALSSFSVEAVQAIDECWRLLSDNQKIDLKKELETLKKHPIKQVKDEFKKLLKKL